jgi:hypothetical protein
MTRMLWHGSLICCVVDLSQVQGQRPHASLQRCHSLLVRQSSPGSGATTHHHQQQQAVAQQAVAQRAEVSLQQLQKQQWQQEALQERSQLLPLGGDEFLGHPSTSYSSSSGSSGSSNSSYSIGSNGSSAAAVAQQESPAAPAELGNSQLSSSSSSSSDSSDRSDSSSNSSSSSSYKGLRADADAASITWSIKHAGSIHRLEAVVSLYSPRLNCIHISAAFVQLQRLWPNSRSRSSSSSSSLAIGTDDAWLSSSINGDLAIGHQLLARLQSLALTVSRIDGRFVANVLHSMAVLYCDHGQRGAYSAGVVNRLCAAAYSLANSMPPQELATLAWALARLAVVPAPALLRRLVSNVLRQLGMCKPQDLLMTLTALPALHQSPGVVAPYATVHKLAAAAGSVMPSASAHEAAGLLAALGALQWHAPPGWLQAYWAAAAPKMAGMGWEQLGMTGWALGQLAPLSAGPTSAWLEAWEAALTQQLQAAPTSSSSSSVPLVELVMVLYGWSKAMPGQRPSQQLQQLVLDATQAAMSHGSSSLSLKQRQRQQRQQQQGQSLPSWRQQLQHQLHLHAAVQQQHPVQQPASHSTSSSSSSSSSQPGVNSRLLGELASAMARWQLLPPRQWLLTYLGAVQQQLLLGGYSIRDLSSMLWGLAKLGVRPKTQWLDLAASAAEQQMQVQAQGIMQLQKQQQAWQQQRTREWAAQQQRRKKSSMASLAAGTSSSSSSSSPSSLRPGLHEGAPHSSSVVQRLGSESQQQLQQYCTVPQQLAVLLWSLDQLQYTPCSGFWDQFWALSVLLLPRQYNARDLAMTLEAVVQQQQQRPPPEWIQAALVAGAAVHLKERLSTASPPKQQRRQQQQQQRRPPSSGDSSSIEGQAGDQQQQELRVGRQLEQQQRFSCNVVRMLCAFARLGVSPGHQWCGGVVENAVRPVAQHMSAQVGQGAGLRVCVCFLGGIAAMSGWAGGGGGGVCVGGGGGGGLVSALCVAAWCVEG